MKKYLLIAFVILISISSLTAYSYRKEIRKIKKQLTESKIVGKTKLSNPLNDKIPENPSEQIYGLDLSHHQQNIDWKKVAEKPPHFIILKTTEGSTHKDTKYDSYYLEAKSKGILVGGYHFFSYESSGTNQAKHFLKTLTLKKGDIIPVLDVEFRKKMKSDTWISQNIEDFISIIEQEIGVKPIVYCEIDYYNRYMKEKYGDEIKLWLSNFWYKPKSDFVLWQKTDKYLQHGIKGTVDYNLFNGKKEDLISICY